MGRGIFVFAAISLVFFLSSGWADEIINKSKAASSTDKYVVIAWNDLGMHCINPSFKNLSILPPFNTLWAQVIRRGDPPKIVTSGISLTYRIVNNQKSAGKTDFWQYMFSLFGINQPVGTGLTGNRLAGTMARVGDHFEATGIPVTPYDDQMNWNPFQTAVVKLETTNPKTPKKVQYTRAVIPISDELNCAKCHAQGMDATANINGGTDSVDINILVVHDFYHGTNGQSTAGINLMDHQPVLCAGCHSDNALGQLGLGDGSSQPLSQSMHAWHSKFPDAGCYDCHPGQTTQCLRTAIGGMGYLGSDPTCVLCHGDAAQVGNSIADGRQPWLKEPTCSRCHGINYSTHGKLYRFSTGHGGVYCSACHNNPHAWWPSKLWADNRQPISLQKQIGPIRDCKVCHTRNKVGVNPHVTIY